jgi:alkaline phosphatase D
MALELAPVAAPGSPVAVEFVTPSLTSQNVDDKMHWAPRTESLAIEADMRTALPHLRWVDLDSHGYVAVDIERDRVSARWWQVETVLERSDAERLGAMWSVERSRPRLVPG